MNGSKMSIQYITPKLLFPFKVPLSKCHIFDPIFISLSHLLHFSFTKYLYRTNPSSKVCAGMNYQSEERKQLAFRKCQAPRFHQRTIKKKKKLI